MRHHLLFFELTMAFYRDLHHILGVTWLFLHREQMEFINLQNFPINAVTLTGFPRHYKKSTEVRVRYDPASVEDDFYISLEMQDGSVRYLIGSDDEVKRMDSKQLCVFLRRYTNMDKFTLKTRV